MNKLQLCNDSDKVYWISKGLNTQPIARLNLAFTKSRELSQNICWPILRIALDMACIVHHA